MKKILILGGTRYLGKAILHQITKKKFEIATLSRSEEKTDVQHFICDRKDSYELKRVFAHFRPNIILDMVNYNKEDSQGISDLYEQGFISDLNHYIMISSFFVYNHFDYQLFSEKKLNKNFNQNNIASYTKTKIESEMILYLSRLMDITTILRLPFVFSADDYSNRFQRLCELSVRGAESIEDSQFKYSLVRKDDAAEAIAKIFNLRPLGITDISNDGYVTNKKLIEILSDLSIPVNNHRIQETESFPYFVNRDICLRSKKIRIRMPIIDALRHESLKYWSSQC
ncbi:NAD-dependent epimerase/dehydratase family protein [Gammaproteobacteria bacterium]|nr:NAD-dependent epimerase/dehydratase family protein [Gammaproteobacteria bacterium]